MIKSSGSRFRVPVVLTLLVSTVPAFGAPRVFLQRHGSPEDNGYMDFVQTAPDAVVEDFEDPSFFTVGAEVHVLTGAGTKIYLESEWNGPYVPQVFASSEFEYPGQFYNQALIGGTELRLIADPGDAPRAIGLWIFDDNSAFDSVYRIRIAECNGRGDEVILANETEFTVYGHELEGFVGAVSEVGICSFSITAIDPVTELPHGDIFEIDHLMVESFAHPRGFRALPPGLGGDDPSHDNRCDGARQTRGCADNTPSDGAR
ncbi:MAG: hypothetical protein O7B26_13075 [Planctomycetota bacterium]|nr:hypothetical protein [Planctomycetota bacterium]